MFKIIRSKIINTKSTLLDTGFFHIFCASVINKVLSALLSVILVRVLSKNDYGAYSYAFNIVSFFVIFNGFGATSAALQICSERFNDSSAAKRIYLFAVKFGIWTDLFITLSILFISIFVTLPIENSNLLLGLYGLYPLLTFVYEIMLIKYRIELNNKAYALITNLQTIIIVVFSIIGAMLFGAVGLIIGQLLTFVLTIIIVHVKSHVQLTFSKLTRNEIFDFLKVSIVSAVNNGISQALLLIGTFLVGLLLFDASQVADYKVSTTIPFALMFIPQAVVVYIYPFFARNKNLRSWTIKKFIQLTSVSATCYFFLTLLLIVFSEWVIVLFFGADYRHISTSFSILMIGFWFNATFRVPIGNLLVTQRKLTSNTFIGVINIAACIILSFLLIPKYGINGAAVAFSLTIIVGSLLNLGFYIWAIWHIQSEQ